MFTRDKTRRVTVGGVTLGGGAPVRVQSMTKTDTRDTAATIKQIRSLADAGCEIIRVAVPDIEAARAIRRIKKSSPIPVVADIHFDAVLAIESIKSGADKIRINPGNMPKDRLKAVVDEAKSAGIPIRIGVNTGSLKSAQGRGLSVEKKAMAVASAARKYCAVLENMDFGDIVVSLKASDVPTTVEAYKIFARGSDYPLHIGITESGPPGPGSIKSAVGIGILLYLRLGDTLRVSLSAPPENEVDEGYAILRSLGLRRGGFDIISCPTCGRTVADVAAVSAALSAELKKISFRPDAPTVKVAVMGCVVNGPGEAREADVGIAAAGREGIIFKKGVPVGKAPSPSSRWIKTLALEAAVLAGRKK
ncbi:MAG: 4-hydroxy-3-methylbut-2-en-1-yl diphosphate synthase [Elusimicrobia bacterium HGW-Elusimicrobia-1]|jgi:(E)-4-hydroxy-3-methylbut-2-enyl-diphosphate synthase|nr:MAG: 4-hydroxy-3-methylbut-2-en-1-yl diphosphate synthase [Elusimicrobia bacterium HGW-Elusimicrobia-1]